MKANATKFRSTSLLMAAVMIATLFGCKKEGTTVPTVTTTSVAEITQNTAKGGCTVTDDGGEPATSGGVCWGTSANPTLSDSHTEGILSGSSYTCTIPGLTAGTGYYVRGYATNSAGTGYGASVHFTTLAAVLPTVTTATPKSVTQTTATLGGSVTFDGGQATTRGVCWSTGENPTVADSKTVDGTGSGTFQSSLTGLTANTTYYAQAYATNGVGTAYGSQYVVKTMYGTVTDYDGNTYQTVLIGTQEWMAENLRVTHYRNGDPIPNITDNGQWSVATSGAWCSYENSSSNASTYGLLYNFYTVADARNLCPTGWHVPTDAEWTTLTDYLGGTSDAWAKMKAPTLWKSGSLATDNYSGFTGIPSGGRFENGIFFQKGENANWWSSTIYSGNEAYFRNIYYLNPEVYRGYQKKIIGYSIRCVKD